MNRTHAVWLRSGVARDDTSNKNTIQLTDVHQAYLDGAVRPGVPAPPLSFRDRFRTYYPGIREICERATSPSLALVAIDNSGIAASAILTPPVSRCTSAIIGRHSMAELYLPDDPTLSLRHLAVIVRPPSRGSDEVRFRLVDLRTSTAFTDENDRQLEAFETEGPVFVTCARYSIYLLPTGGDLPWPDDGADAWDCIPDRVYLDDSVAEPDRWERKKLRPTFIQPLHGPILAERRMLAEGEPALAELQLSSPLGAGSIIVGHSTLKDGVLLGRSARCDCRALGVLSSAHISRVHLLVMEVGGEIYAIDTASTQGIWRNGERVRIARLTPGCELELDTVGTRLRWEVVRHDRPVN